MSATIAVGNAVVFSGSVFEVTGRFGRFAEIRTFGARACDLDLVELVRAPIADLRLATVDEQIAARRAQILAEPQEHEARSESNSPSETESPLLGPGSELRTCPGLPPRDQEVAKLKRILSALLDLDVIDHQPECSIGYAPDDALEGTCTCLLGDAREALGLERMPTR